MSSTSCNLRNIANIIPKPYAHWVGDGFHVVPVFNNLAFTNSISPFLMFDYGFPKYFEPTKRRLGVGVHPHRGFETVTIAFQGEVEHGDSQGNKGVIKSGDVQWMTAGRGIVHEEFHSKEFATTGGTLEMAQLWVNLPSKYKMSPPKYQPIIASEIKEIQIDDTQDIGIVRLIAGNYKNQKGPASTFSPINIWDVCLKAGHSFQFEVENDFNCILFPRQGNLIHKGTNDKKTTFEPGSVILLERTSESSYVHVEATNEDTKFLVLSGQPLDEPIAARGPFVMNTQAELNQAMTDYQNDNFL